EDEKTKGEADKDALEKKLMAATNEVWPSMLGEYKSQIKKIDANDAVEHIGNWKGTVIHFSGGAKGVNLNRAGWNYEGDYDFIVEINGVPICGNFDDGLTDAVKKVREQIPPGMPDNCEECIGIIDGTCKVFERVQAPLEPDRYIRGRQLDGVRFRIVAWKACA